MWPLATIITRVAGLANLQENNLTFTAGADGCIQLEVYETFDDYLNPADADITAGTLTLTGCPTGLVLPIELVSFTTKPLADHNLVQWQTASELNTAWHILERSTNGKAPWQEVGRLAGAGTTNEDRFYSLNDYELLPMIYYRLREEDFDGQERISKVIVLERPSAPFQIQRLVPNPNNGRFSLELKANEPGPVMVRIFDYLGQTVWQDEIMAANESLQHQFNIEGLEQGKYTIVLQKDFQVIVKPLVITK